MPRAAADQTTSPPPPTPPPALPPIVADPWAWVAAAPVLLMVARALGAPLGEPFADDFTFLRHALFGEGWNLLDGGGAVIYWRPLSRQGYFGLLAPLMLDHPRWLAALHAGLLATASVLIYRGLRPRWPGPWAAAAASFPVLAESSRALLLWPSAFQDLGAILFSALALHQTARRRLIPALAALAAALLCKEIAVVTGLLMLWGPGQEWPPGARRRWGLTLAATMAAWALAYLAVMNRAGILFQRDLEGARPALAERFGWALGASLGDGFGLGALAAAAARGLATAVAILLLGAAGWTLRSQRSRLALRRSLPWIAWGLVWFLANTATLTEVFPVWGPFRSAFGMIGLGVAVVALLGAAGPAWLGLMMALRVAALVATPGPPPRVSNMPYQEGVPLDYASLTRLSRLTVAAREALRASHPRLPHGAVVAWHHRPMMADHAFAHGKALQVWYRDTTLRWTTWSDLQARPERPAEAVLEFEALQARQVVVLAPAAVAAYLQGLALMTADRCAAALGRFARADSLQADRSAVVFLGTLAGKRAVCLLAEGDLHAARGEAERSLERWRDGGDARYVMAVSLVVEGRLGEARAQVDSLLARYPFDPSGRALLDSIVARQGGR